MKKNILTILLSVLLSGLVAYGVGKSNVSGASPVQEAGSENQASQYRTVNLSLEDYPDFTFAAESAVDAAVSSSATSIPASRVSGREADRVSSSAPTAI